MIGAPGSTNQAGETYVYENEGGAWIWKQTLSAADGRTGDKFGSPSLDGDRVLIAADYSSAIGDPRQRQAGRGGYA